MAAHRLAPCNDIMDDLLVEGIDFYYENGLMVFTAEYLKKRGYCCRSGCRHCPYGYDPEQDEAT